MLKSSFPKIVTVALCIVITGCMIVRKPSVEELRALDTPPTKINAKIEHFLPGILAWYDEVETQLLPQGRTLSEAENKIARKLGVLNPELIRVVVLDTFPVPRDPELKAEAERYGLGSRLEGGRTMDHVIMLKPRFAENAIVLTHELVHISQYGRMGRIGFLRRYLTEMEMMGYARSPLELEAYSKQSSVQRNNGVSANE